MSLGSRHGHREKGSCEDIEVLREPGALDAADYMSAIKALNPKGKTPMTAAVRMAAELPKYTERKASVILVSDGIETCGLDPCAVAEELEKLGVDLMAHTVGFGLDNQGAIAQLKVPRGKNRRHLYDGGKCQRIGSGADQDG